MHFKGEESFAKQQCQVEDESLSTKVLILREIEEKASRQTITWINLVQRYRIILEVSTLLGISAVLSQFVIKNVGGSGEEIRSQTMVQPMLCRCYKIYWRLPPLCRIQTSIRMDYNKATTITFYAIRQYFMFKTLQQRIIKHFEDSWHLPKHFHLRKITEIQKTNLYLNYDRKV